MAEQRIYVVALAGWMLGGCSGPAELDAGAIADADTGPDSGTADASAPPLDAGSDAGPPEPPCEPGATRVGGCGFCGTQGQLCTDAREWMATSECLGQGECGVGTVEERSGDQCSRDQRICLDGCVWGAWEETVAPGECEPGDTRTSAETCPPGEVRDDVCTDACAWMEGTTCRGGCAGSARTSPEWEREVCVSGGEFLRGDPTGATVYTPSVPIDISPFYIDVYPVTYRRYDQCVRAGACATPSGLHARPDSAYLDYPVQGISREMAGAFCTWDGRRFPTSMEWEKAARGPSPRAQTWPWGDTVDCSIVSGNRPPCSVVADTSLGNDPYDAFPSTADSFYGVRMMGFGVPEWVQDNYCGPFLGWYAEPESMVDNPVCTSSSPGYEAGIYMSRGGTRGGMREVFYVGRASSGTSPDVRQGIRCARNP